MGNQSVSLRLTVPICGFRKGFAREYFETEEVPPPSTLYGFLLSLVGEEDRRRYLGTRLAYALLTRKRLPSGKVLDQPELSVVLRTVWRIKEKSPPGLGSNRRPDYQEILTGLELCIWVGPGELAQRLQEAAANPQAIVRYGGLSLGESRDLINDLDWFPTWPEREALWLASDPQGDLPLPLWVDHVGSKGTVWEQFRLTPGELSEPLASDPRWITIVGPQG
jgi:CRISPR-associated protein Cas5t